MVPLAERLIQELRGAADADAEALRAYIQTYDPADLREVPAVAFHLAQEALRLCTQAAPLVTGLFAADVKVAAALVKGSRDSIEACMTANLLAA